MPTTVGLIKAFIIVSTLNVHCVRNGHVKRTIREGRRGREIFQLLRMNHKLCSVKYENVCPLSTLASLLVLAHLYNF